MENEQSKSQTDRIAALQEAIRNLERFNLSNKNVDVPTIQHLDIKEGKLVAITSSGLKKTISLFASVFSKDTDKSTRRLKVEQKLLDSIAYLKTHWRVIDKLKEGNEEEQKVASWALETIQQYNNLIKKTETPSPSLVDKVFKTIYEHSGLSVGEGLSKNPVQPPKDISIYFHTSQKKLRSDSSDFTMHKIASFLQLHGMLVCMPTTMEIDFFHMKSITLARNSELPDSLSRYLMQWMHKIPIQSMITQDNESVDNATSIIHLKQTLTPFPGEEITIEGKFQRDPSSSVPSIPIHDSFHVTTKAVQTGYPHPSQHIGWGLTKAFIADQPNRIDLLPDLQPLLEKIPHIADQLLPKGLLNEKAKELLINKKEAFADHLKEFLNRHRHLNIAMIKACPYPFVTEMNPTDLNAVINNFFDFLISHNTPYEMLSRCYQQVNNLFIEKPCDGLKREWIDEANPSLWEGTAKEKHQNAQNIFKAYQEHYQESFIAKEDDEEGNKVVKNWILLMGEILGQAGLSIILQHQSEKIGFVPPLLNNFERAVQQCAYEHLVSFIAELEAPGPLPNLEDTYQSLVNHLMRDTALFQTEKEDTPSDQLIVHQLEIYYNSQHYRS